MGCGASSEHSVGGRQYDDIRKKRYSISAAQADRMVKECWKKIDTGAHIGGIYNPNQNINNNYSNNNMYGNNNYGNSNYGNSNYGTVNYGNSSSNYDYRKNTNTGGSDFSRRVARIFVSSTFVDFQNERDILAKQIFPELRDWCRQNDVTLIDIDLRWGVPMDATTNQTAATCLSELDRCIEETDGRPFFLNMIGDRYGWIPYVRENFNNNNTNYNYGNNYNYNYNNQYDNRNNKNSKNQSTINNYDNRFYNYGPPPPPALFNHHPNNNYAYNGPPGNNYQIHPNNTTNNNAYGTGGFDAGDLTSEIVRRYQWIPYVSMTHMEILQGAYRRRDDGNPNAAFFFRDPRLTNQLPQNVTARFHDDPKDELSKAHMKALKERLRNRYGRRGQVFDYSCHRDNRIYTDPVTGRPVLRFTGLENDFGEKVLRFFKNAIRRQFHLDDYNRGPGGQIGRRDGEFGDDELGSDQRAFLEETGESFIGRTCILEMLDRYVDEPYVASSFGDDFRRGGGSKLLCLACDSGEGKTSVLAEFVRRRRSKQQNQQNFFYHFPNANADSATQTALLVRLNRFFQRSRVVINADPRLPAPVMGYDADANASTPEYFLNTVWPSLRSVSGPGGIPTNFLIVIDALDEFDTMDSPQHLEWLPPVLPINVTLIVSCDQRHAPTMARLQAHEADVVKMAPLPDDEQRHFITETAKRYGKILDADQTDRFLRKGRSPAWTVLAFEELRVSGDFRAISSLIDSLPNTLQEMISYALNRLRRQDDSSIKTVESMRLLACGDYGLTETDMEQLLGNSSDAWNRTKVFLRPFVRFLQSWKTGAREKMIVFNWPIISTVVKQQFMNSADSYKNTHSRLADYYNRDPKYNNNSSINSNDVRFLGQVLPHHFFKAERRQDVVKFFMFDPHSVSANTYQRRDYMRKVKCPNVVNVYGGQGMPNQQNAYLCTSCAGEFKGTSVESLKNNTCFFCHGTTYGGGGGGTGQGGYPALLCHQHATQTDQCMKCKRHQSKEMLGRTYFPLLLCMFCVGPSRMPTCSQLPF